MFCNRDVDGEMVRNSIILYLKLQRMCWQGHNVGGAAGKCPPKHSHLPPKENFPQKQQGRCVLFCTTKILICPSNTYFPHATALSRGNIIKFYPQKIQCKITQSATH